MPDTPAIFSASDREQNLPPAGTMGRPSEERDMTTDTEKTNLENAREALRRHFGYADFRPGQDEIVRSILEGRDTLAVMPTGGGKSICYQTPAVLFDGLTIVVSPLISLMQDQVDALEKARIKATVINSMLDFRDAAERMEKARRGFYKLVYVAPERFESQAFLERMSGVRGSLFAIDEAHCISEWGHDFRPSYMKLRGAVERLGSPPIAALTATATPDVRDDIVRQLGLRNPNIIVRGFNRENLTFRVAKGVRKREAILQACGGGETGIVYAGTRNTVEELAGMLAGHGIRAEAYHAGLDDVRRKETQERFMRGDTRIIVATTAFGMGIDKADVRFVMHHDMPGTIEQYYQEAGRAGRDGRESVCTLLHHAGDRSLPEFFIRQTYPDRAMVQTVYGHLHNAAGTQLGQTFRGLVNLSAQSIAAGIGKAGEAAVRGALDLLERSGYIRRIESQYAETTVRILYPPDRLRQWLIEAAPDALAPIAVALLRTAGGEAFHYPVNLFIGEVAEKTFRPEDQIVAGLRELHALGIVDFHSGRIAGGIALLGARVPSRDLAIDYKSLEALMRRQNEKLQAMERYILGSACRRNMILEYFHEDDVKGVCGKCDNCLSSTPIYRSETPEDVFERCATAVMTCVAELNGRFGSHVIVDVLRGGKSKRIEQFRLSSAPSYGKAAEEGRDSLFRVIDALIGLGWLGKSERTRPALRLTKLGREKLGREIQVYELPAYGEALKGELRDPVLFEALRAVRRRIAGELLIPSHVLISDETLVNVANAAPTNEDELDAVEGIGPVTMKRVGRHLLNAVREHMHERGTAEAAARARDALPALSPSVRSTLALCAQGLSLAEIAAERELTDGIVSQHIAELLGRGVALDMDALLPPKRQHQIRAALQKMRRPDLKKVKSMVDAEITFAEIRVVSALVEREKTIRAES